jgi:hypothetical protein
MAPVFFPLHNIAVRRPLLNLTFIFSTNHLTAANTFWGIEVAFATLLNRSPISLWSRAQSAGGKI